MPSRCWILGCPSNIDRSNTRFFKFPQNEELKQLWIDAIKRDVAPSESSRVCSKHFKTDDILTATPFKKEPDPDSSASPRYLRLKPGAVPCIFEGLKPRRIKKKGSPAKKKSISPEKETRENPPSVEIEERPSTPSTEVLSSDLEKSIDTSPTTDKPIITVIKAQDVEKEASDEEEKEEEPVKKLKSPIIKSNARKVPHDLPSPYKHLHPVSVCLKEEDRIVFPQDGGKSLKRTSSICSNGSSGTTEAPKAAPQQKRRKVERPAPIVIGRQNDCYCWICHRENVVLSCIACPRAYHQKCAGEMGETPDWVCPECQRIVTAENVDTRSSVLSEISLDRLCALLRFCLTKMKHRAGVAFHQPVSLEHYPMYLHYVIHPMDFCLLEKNIKQKLYGCTEAFLADVKWILHNSCVFNGAQHPLSTNAKSLVKTCENDMQEIEVCPDCFMHSVIRNKYWFADVCRKPHPLVWAKLKGFPYWPAKIVRILDNNVDARFFGAHDRAWVPITQCYHLSKETPTTSKPKKKGNYETALDELNVHVQLLIQKFGSFEYAPNRTTFDPRKKVFMYHGIDIDKIDKKEIPFDASASNREFCASPTDVRRISTESKMDIDQCEDISSNSLISTPDLQISKKHSIDEDKEIVTPLKDKLKNINDGSELNIAKQSEPCSENFESTPVNKSLSKSDVPRNKLELALERIKGYVSIDNEEDKESSSKEEEPEKVEVVKKLSVSTDGTCSILAGLKKTKTLPKVDLPDLPTIETEDTTKEKAPFLDMSKKKDMFSLHLLETIKKAKSRTTADDEGSDIMEVSSKEDTDSESAGEDDEEGDDDEQDAVDENESSEEQDEVEEKGGKEAAAETVSASDQDTADDSESGESESSSESSDTDIEEIIEESKATDKNVEKASKNMETEKNKKNDESLNNVLSLDESSNSQTSNNEPTSNINLEKEEVPQSSGSIPMEISSNQSSDIQEKHKDSDADLSKNKEIDLEMGDMNTSASVKNLDEKDQVADLPLNNEMEEDDEIIICPPVKPPTPPLICLDDGTDTEPENENTKIKGNSSSPENLKPPPLSIKEKVDKPSFVRVLKFNRNESTAKMSSSNKRPRRRLLISSSDDSSEDEYVVNRERAIPLTGAKRTFNNLTHRNSVSNTETASSVRNSVSNTDTASSVGAQENYSELPKSHNSNVRQNSAEKLTENSHTNESRPNVEQDVLPQDVLLQDGSSHTATPENSSDTEIILRLKKKLGCLFAAFQLQHWKNEQEKKELRHNMNLIIMEMRASLEADKKQAIETLSRSFERQKRKAVEDVKKSQWCALCLKEARYQCCWNTSYCSVQCQKRSFAAHRNACTNKSSNVTNEPKPIITPTNEIRDNKKVFLVNMMPKNDAKSSSNQTLSGNFQHVTVSKSQIQVVPPKTNLAVMSSVSSPSIASNSSIQYILAPVKSNEVTESSKIISSGGQQTQTDSSDNSVKTRTDLAKAIYLLKKKNQESEAALKKDESKTNDSDLEEVYFPSPPQVSFEGLDSASPDESIQIGPVESSEKNSSDVEVLSQESEKKDESSTEGDISCSDTEDDNQLVNIGYGVEVKAKFLNKCLIYGTSPKKLTRCLVDVLFPDLKLLADCSAFGQKSNVTKGTRAALPAKKVAAILEYVQKRYPAATRTEVVLAINMKCKEARNIVEKNDSKKPIRKTLFRRLLARDQSLDGNINSTVAQTSTPVATSSNSASLKIQAPVIPVTTVSIVRNPSSTRICIKAPPSTPFSSESATSPTKTVTAASILRCNPPIRPRMLLQPVSGTNSISQPRMSQSVRSLLSNSQTLKTNPQFTLNSKDPKKVLMPLDAFKQSINIAPTTSGTGNSPRPLIIIGTPTSAAPQTLSVTQPTSLPSSIIRK